MIVSKKTFEKHIRYLTKHYVIISLEQYIESRHGIPALPRNALVITFDDGFKDNFEIAFPLLVQYRCMATFFLIGCTLQPREMIWLHRLYNAIDSIQDKIMEIHIGGFQKKYFITPKGKRDMMQDVRSHLKGMSKAQRAGFLDEFEKHIAYKSDSENFYLTGSEVNIMMNKGMSFGVHSMEHPVMAQLDDADAEYEISMGKNILEKITGAGKIPFAFPFGGRGTWSSSSLDLLKKHQLSCGLTTIEGMNGPGTDIYALKRIEIGEYTLYELALHITGIIGFFKGMGRSFAAKGCSV